MARTHFRSDELARPPHPAARLGRPEHGGDSTHCLYRVKGGTFLLSSTEAPGLLPRRRADESIELLSDYRLRRSLCPAGEGRCRRTSVRITQRQEASAQSSEGRTHFG